MANEKTELFDADKLMVRTSWDKEKPKQQPDKPN